MARFSSDINLARRIEAEGGAINALQSGITLTDLASIDNLPPELLGSWAMAEMALDFFRSIDSWAKGTLDAADIDDREIEDAD